jgi:hypothetical protein
MCSCLPFITALLRDGLLLLDLILFGAALAMFLLTPEARPKSLALGMLLVSLSNILGRIAKQVPAHRSYRLIRIIGISCTLGAVLSVLNGWFGVIG